MHSPLQSPLQPVMRSPMEFRRRSAFDPVKEYFGSGEQGLIYDISDMSTLFQDSAGTIPVTAADQYVGKMLDTSGNGHHATQPTAGKLPQLKTDGLYWWLEGDGISRFMVTGNIDFTGTGTMTVFAGVRKEDDALRMAFELGNSYADNGMMFLATGNNVGTGYSSLSKGDAAAVPEQIAYSSTYSGVDTATIVLTSDIPGDLGKIWRNGASGTDSTADKGAGNFGSLPLFLFCRNGDSSFSNGRLYSLILRGAETIEELIDSGTVWTYRRNGANLPYLITPSEFSDSEPAIDKTSYLETSAFAQVVISTSATSVEITSVNNISGAFPDYAEIGVIVDGVFNQSVQVATDGTNTNAITLPAGSKTVSLINGLQSKPSSLIGTFIKSVRANSAMTQLFPTATNRMLIYGDSITVGGNALQTQQNAWVMQLRRYRGSDSTMIEGWGYRSLNDDAGDSTKRAAFVAKVVSANPATLWMAIGTNDYGLNKWSAASFGTAYAALLDDLHTALPSLVIYCQTPILRSAETANGSGSTTVDYRTQIATAVSSRTGYCTLVDGTSLVTLSDIPDGVHPSDAGHSIYYAAVKTALGI